MILKTICTAFSMALIIGVGTAHAQYDDYSLPVHCPSRVSSQLTANLTASQHAWSSTPTRVSLTGVDIVEIRGRQVLTCSYGVAGTFRVDAPSGTRCRQRSLNSVRSNFVCTRDTRTRDNR
jgi:hypothetical protein